MDLDSFDLADFLPYRIAILSERTSRRLSLEYARSHGLSMAEWRVLVHLLRHQEVSVREIHRRANLEKPRISRAVTRLATAGLVRKAISPRDSRLVAISLTEAGREVLRRVIPDALDFEARLQAALSKEELAHFYEITEKIHGVLDDDPLAPPRPDPDSRS